MCKQGKQSGWENPNLIEESKLADGRKRTRSLKESHVGERQTLKSLKESPAGEHQTLMILKESPAGERQSPKILKESTVGGRLMVMIQSQSRQSQSQRALRWAMGCVSAGVHPGAMIANAAFHRI